MELNREQLEGIVGGDAVPAPPPIPIGGGGGDLILELTTPLNNGLTADYFYNFTQGTVVGLVSVTVTKTGMDLPMNAAEKVFAALYP